MSAMWGGLEQEKTGTWETKKKEKEEGGEREKEDKRHSERAV